MNPADVLRSLLNHHNACGGDAGGASSSHHHPPSRCHPANLKNGSNYLPLADHRSHIVILLHTQDDCLSLLCPINNNPLEFNSIIIEIR